MTSTRCEFRSDPAAEAARSDLRDLQQQDQRLVVEALRAILRVDRGDLAYLLAALRLERLQDPVRRSDAQRAVARLRARRRGDPQR